MEYFGKTGIKYVPTTEIATGGEGTIYNLQAPFQDKVIKVYKPDKRPQDSSKLEAMQAFVPNNIQFFNQVAWILDIVRENDEILAVVQKKISGKTVKEILLDRSIDWEIRLKIAMNFCGLLHFMHSENQVIGDFNDNNFLIDTTDYHLQMVDADSMHFKDKGGKIHRCGVLMNEVISPELAGVHLDTAPLPTFTKETDRWALAIHIFRLLMYGWHPFAASVANPSGQQSSVTVQHKRVKKGIIPFLKKYNMLDIPLKAPEFDWVFPQRTRKMFERTFIDGHSNPSKRISENEWFDELKHLSQTIKTCSKNGTHKYTSEVGECPWCKLEQKLAAGHMKKLVSQFTQTSTPVSNTCHPKPVVATQAPSPRSATLQYQPLKQLSDLWDLRSLLGFLAKTLGICTVVSLAFVFITTGTVSLSGLISSTMLLALPYLLVGGLIYGRDQILKNVGVENSFMLGILGSIIVTSLYLVNMTSLGSISFMDYWQIGAWIAVGYVLGSTLGRLIQRGLVRLPFTNPQSFTGLMSTISMVSLTFGLVACGAAWLIGITGREFWGTYYVDSLPSWLQFVDDIFSIKIFSQDQSAAMIWLTLLTYVPIVILPELRKRIPSYVSVGIEFFGIVFGYLLLASYFYSFATLFINLFIIIIMAIIIFFFISIIAG